MRVGVVTTNFPPARGGMQEHARSLVTVLAREHDVQLFVRPGDGLEAPIPRLTVTDRMTWFRARDLPLLHQTDVAAWLLLDAGLADYVLGLRQPSFVYVHGNDFLRPWYPREDLIRRGQAWAMRRLGIPGSETMVMNWRRRRVGAGLRAAQGVFANSTFSRANCQRMYGLRDERVHVVPPGIAPGFFQEAARTPSPALRLLTVSRLHAHFQRKNVDGVLRALALIGDAFPWHYAIVGDGSDRPRLQALAGELGIGERVEFLGETSHERLLQAYAENDVFIMPVRASPTDAEGFGMVFAEAAAAGMPSIATDAGGISDIVKPGLSGVLIEGGEPEHIADSIRRFRSERDRFDPAAIRAFARQFSAEDCTERLMATVREHVRPDAAASAPAPLFSDRPAV